MTLLFKIYQPAVRATSLRFINHHAILPHVATKVCQPQALATNRIPSRISSLLLCDHTSVASYKTSASLQILDMRPEPRIKRSSPLRSGRNKFQSIVELMRLNKPTGIWLAYAPSLWAMFMALPYDQTYMGNDLVSIFGLGAIVARAMGCTLNDLLDKDYDRKVERTMMRPIACGDISTREALVLLFVQSTTGLYILFQNNPTVIGLGLFSGLMISTYPLFKRFTYWPQIMLGLTINWGTLMGYAAVNGPIGLADLSVLLPLYLSANFWTLYYDTIYAHQDRKDDLFVGVKSSAIKLGENTHKFLLLMSLGMHSSLAYAGYMSCQQSPFFIALASTAILHFYQVKSLNLRDPENCWRAFDRQGAIGFILVAGLALSTFFRRQKHGLTEREKKEVLLNKQIESEDAIERAKFW